MMTGMVSQRRAMMPVTFRLPNQPDLTIEFIVDTGFNDYLTLPPAAVAAMGLPFLTRTYADLADGTTVAMNVYIAAIVWHGRVLNVPVLAAGKRPLLGTTLLDDCELLVQFRNGGLVTIGSL